MEFGVVQKTVGNVVANIATILRQQTFQHENAVVAQVGAGFL